MKHFPVALLLAVATTAHADDGERKPRWVDCSGDIIGLLDVSTQGVSKEARDGFISTVENSLQMAGLCVGKNRALLDYLAESSYVDGCFFGPCLQAVYRRTQVRRVIIARITGVGSAYSLMVSLVDTQSGKLISQEAQTCPVCTVDEALMQASNVVIETVMDRIVPDPSPIAVAPAPVAVDRGPRNQKVAGRVAGVLLGVGLAAVAAGGVLIGQDHDAAGSAMIGAGAGVALSGTIFWAISRKF
jgi:hypothetical protein